MFKLNKKIIIYLSVGVWPFFALITFLNLKFLLAKECSFLTSWPFCNLPLFGWEWFGQYLILLISFALLVFSGKHLFTILEGKNFLQFKKIKWVVFVLVVSAVFILPFTSADLNYYFNVGSAVDSGINPYIEDRGMQNNYIAGAEEKIGNGVMYGPITVIIFGFFYKLSGGEIFLFVLLFKIFIVLVLLIIASLVWKLAKNNNLNNQRYEPQSKLWAQLFGVSSQELDHRPCPVPRYEVGIKKEYFYLFFLIQPLILWEWIVNGHFDGLWLVFVLLALIFSQKQKWWLVIPCLVIGIWIKFIPLLMAPWFALWWWQGVDKNNYKKQIIQVFSGIILSGFITWFVWYNYWVGFEVFKTIALQSKWAVSSIFAVSYYSIKPLFEFVIGSNYHWYLTRILHALLFAVFIYMIYPYIKKAFLILFKKLKFSQIEYIQAIFVTMLVYLFIWQKSFWPWYLVWLLPLGYILFIKTKNIFFKKIIIWTSTIPLLFYIPQMLLAGDMHRLSFFYYVVGLIMIYPLFQLYKWRKKDYEFDSEY